MEFAHLPVAGGIYDQDPELLRRWQIIWAAQARKQKADDAKRKAEQKRAGRRR